MELFTITDLSHVWVEADVYQDEAGSVRVGQPAAITPPSGAGPTLRGRVDFINPFVSPETRTLRVRFDFDNPGLSLKPDMFVNVEMTLRAAPALTIPDNAVIDTGVRQVVFVDRGGGVFVPREVRVGTRSDGRAEVLSGLAEGEHVATRANFLLDSESRLRAALAATSPPAAAGAASGHEGHGR
jgi:RND family efflux transporter MFP subunit